MGVKITIKDQDGGDLELTFDDPVETLLSDAAPAEIDPANLKAAIDEIQNLEYHTSELSTELNCGILKKKEFGAVVCLQPRARVQ